MAPIIGFSAGSGLAEQISVGEIGKSLAGAMFKTGDGYLGSGFKRRRYLKSSVSGWNWRKVCIKVLK